MAIRTTSGQVTFSAPFHLKEIDEQLPAGTYDLDTDEEVYEGNDRTVFVRVATLIRIPYLNGTRTVSVDPRGLDAALHKDRSALS